MFLDHTQRRTSVGRTPLDEWSARHTDLYLITHYTHNRHIHAPGGIRSHTLSMRAAPDLRLRPRGYWDLLKCTVPCIVNIFIRRTYGIYKKKMYLRGNGGTELETTRAAEWYSASPFKPEHFYQYEIVISVNWLLELPVFVYLFIEELGNLYSSTKDG